MSAPLAFALLLLPACADLAAERSYAPGPEPTRQLAAEAPANTDARGGFARTEGGDAMSGQAAPGQAVAGLHLVRTGELSLAVDAYAPFEAELEAWLTRAGGFVSDATLEHSEGEVSWAWLTVRVPAEHLDALVGWTEEQVRVERLSLASVDVTEEWVDLSARIDNGRLEEARLQQLLATSTGSLADVLAVERELARVRGEVERAEGRLRVLQDQVALSTLTLSVRVEDPYQSLVRASFGEEVAATLQASVQAMVSVGRSATLAGVAAAPWVLPPLALGALLLRRRRSRAALS